jgi:SagB-type dehydrogenase family enzyme
LVEHLHGKEGVAGSSPAPGSDAYPHRGLTPSASSHPLRPLAQLVPRPDGDDALVFVTPDREVRVEGDPRLVGEILSRCDGLSTVDEIARGFGDGMAADVRELIDTLAEQEVVVDCTRAYRRLHRHGDPRSGLFRALTDDELARLQSERFEPRTRVARREALDPLRGPLLDLTERRRSAWPGEGRGVSFRQLSTLLAAMYRGSRDGPGGPVPSAGALHPLAVHVLIRDPVPPLDAGLWWYDARSDELGRLRDGDIPVDHLFLPYPGTESFFTGPTPILFISADLERPARKYANRGYRYALMEAGAAMQNAYLAATEVEVPVRAIGGFDDEGIAELLGLRDDVVPLLALVVGA